MGSLARVVAHTSIRSITQLHRCSAASPYRWRCYKGKGIKGGILSSEAPFVLSFICLPIGSLTIVLGPLEEQNQRSWMKKYARKEITLRTSWNEKQLRHQ